MTIQGTKLRLAVVHRAKRFTKVCGEARAGKSPYHFIEFMACPGGCIAGAGTILSIADATKGVEASMKQASKKNPLESQYAEMAEELD